MKLEKQDFGLLVRTGKNTKPERQSKAEKGRERAIAGIPTKKDWTASRDISEWLGLEIEFTIREFIV